MRRAAALVLLASAAACAAPGGDPPLRRYDLGAEGPAARLPPLRAVLVEAAAPFDGAEMHYRLAWRDPAEVAAFAHSRWAAPVPELLRRQLVRALPAQSGALCALEVELHEFIQVFSSPQASEVRLGLRAGAGGAARDFRVVEPAAGANAATGAQAFARASERAIAEIAAWVVGLAACR